MDNIEPAEPKNDSGLIFGVNQSQEGFVNPAVVLPIDELGNPINQRLPKDSIIITHYWIKKKKTIASLGVISALMLVAVLVQETGIFDTIFQTATNLMAIGFNYMVGIFT